MPQVLIRRLDEETVERLKARARRAGWSLEEECRLALKTAAIRGDLLAATDVWRRMYPEGEEEAFSDLRQRGPGRPVEFD